MTERILGDQELQNNIDNFLYKHMNGLALKPGAIKEAKDSLYQLVLESSIDRLKLLKQEYHNNIVSDDRMDLEIDESIAQLQSQLLSIGESK